MGRDPDEKPQIESMISHWRKAPRRAILLLVVLSPAILVGTTVWTLTTRYADQIYLEPESGTIPARPVALVFGAGYWGDGTLSDVLRDRLDSAIALYRAGQVEKLLLSGDNRVAEYNEPARMREYALSQGVDDQDVVLDFAGRRTYDTCYRARHIFQLNGAILVTQRYHIPRALATCRGLGLEVIAFAADRTPYVHIRWYWLREVPALWRAWWDLYIGQPTPVLGDPLPIFP